MENDIVRTIVTLANGAVTPKQKGTVSSFALCYDGEELCRSTAEERGGERKISPPRKKPRRPSWLYVCFKQSTKPAYL